MLKLVEGFFFDTDVNHGSVRCDLLVLGLFHRRDYAVHVGDVNTYQKLPKFCQE